MATWIWRWRRTMQEKGPWIARTASPHFARPAITCRKCRMHISGQVRDASKACGLIRERFAKIPTRMAARFSPTIESCSGYLQVASHVGSGDSPKQELGRKAGALLGQNFLHRTFARVSPVFLVAGLAFACPALSHAKSSGAQPEKAVPRAFEDADTRNTSGRR